MKRKKKVLLIAKATGITMLAVLSVIFPEESAESVINSINVCISSIIPSMFAFMVITTYIQTSGIYRLIFRPVMPIMRRIIKADDCILSVFLLSLIGGYPVGIKLLNETIAQNKNYPAIVQTCGNAASFCYCISPTFAVIMLGNGVFGSSVAGIVIYISDILACLLTGAVISRFCGLKTGATGSSSGGGLTDAVNSASRALFTVCTVIVAFNAALVCCTSLLREFGITLPVPMLGTLEISNLLGMSRPDVKLIPLAAAISSTGGVCVLLQCTAIVKGEFPVKRFLTTRIPCAMLSALISFLILQFVDVSVSVSTYAPEYTYDFSANKVIVLILIAMCIIIFHKTDKILKKV